MLKTSIVGIMDELKNYKSKLNRIMDKPVKDYEEMFYTGELVVGFVIGSLMMVERQLTCIYENKKFKDNFKIHYPND